MAEYIFTSKAFTGFLKFAYDDEGILQKFENSAALDIQQLTFLSRNFPFAASDLTRIAGTGTIEETTDTTFKTFWEKYGYKVGKINAEKQWLKLDEASKAKAISKIAKYKHYCKGHNYDIIYPERYLKYRRFDDE